MPHDRAAAVATVEEHLQGLRPRHALSEYYHLNGGAALFPQFVAVAAGLRPGMDCWIPCKHLDRFRRFVEGLGLSSSCDCAFRKLPVNARHHVVGIETLCTTHALGVRLEDASAEDEAHVFVAVNGDIADEMRACGWYPVVVNDRFVHKPVVDHLAFGRLLGYPACCRRFFEASNNWHRTNSYAEAYLQTTGACHPLTNCFGKNLGYSLSFHLPCRFDCPDTIRFSSGVADVLEQTEPEYAAACQALLRKPVLCLNERETLLFDGVRIGDGRLTYTSAVNLFYSIPEPLSNAIEQGNVVEVRGRFVVVFRDADIVDVFECRSDDFGPRVPLLIDWSQL